jgi:hypothetical protein
MDPASARPWGDRDRRPRAASRAGDARPLRDLGARDERASEDLVERAKAAAPSATSGRGDGFTFSTAYERVDGARLGERAAPDGAVAAPPDDVFEPGAGAAVHRP